MPAGFTAFGNHGVRARAFHALGQRGGSHDWDHLDIDAFPHIHIFAGVARARRNDRDLFLGADTRHIVGKRTEQHHIDAERFIGERFRLADHGLHHVAGRGGRADQPQTARVGNSRRQLRVGHPGHSALKKRMPDTEHFGYLCF